MWSPLCVDLSVLHLQVFLILSKIFHVHERNVLLTIRAKIFVNKICTCHLELSLVEARGCHSVCVCIKFPGYNTL